MLGFMSTCKQLRELAAQEAGVIVQRVGLVEDGGD